MSISLVKEQVQTIAIVVVLPEALNSEYRYSSHHDFFPTIFQRMQLNIDTSALMNGKDLAVYDPEKDFALVHMSVLSLQKCYEEAVIEKGLKVQYHLKDKLLIQPISNEDDDPIADYTAVEANVYKLIKKALHSKTQGLE